MLDHLDVASLLEMLDIHADCDPQRMLFLWNLFEGVPKFYRDAYEQGVLNTDRPTLLRALFFSSSSQPSRSIASTNSWTLHPPSSAHDK